MELKYCGLVSQQKREIALQVAWFRKVMPLVQATSLLVNIKFSVKGTRLILDDPFNEVSAVLTQT
jgi:hypothetical protein